MATIADACGDAINRGDIDGFLEWVSPDVEFTSMIAEAEGETFRGHAGVRQRWTTVREMFDAVTWTYEEVKAHGDAGIARLRIDGTISGAEAAQTMWQAVILRDGKGLWWGFFRDRAEALEALAEKQEAGKCALRTRATARSITCEHPHRGA